MPFDYSFLFFCAHLFKEKKDVKKIRTHMDIVLFIVSRVCHICLSVIIRNWRSAISPYYRITFLVARLLAFMTFFYSFLFFLLSFFLSCTKVHSAVAERSLFIYIRWQTMELVLLHSTYWGFSLFVLYLLLLLLVVVLVNEKYRRLLFFSFLL